MVNLLDLHAAFGPVLLTISTVMVGSLLYWNQTFNGTKFARSWNTILVSTVFLFWGAVADAVLMYVPGAEQVSSIAVSAIVQEVFLLLFLTFLGYGLYSMTRINRCIIQARGATNR